LTVIAEWGDRPCFSFHCKHSERLGCRGFDLLHVALALELKCESFLTSDAIQGVLARAEGLEVTIAAEK